MARSSLSLVAILALCLSALALFVRSQSGGTVDKLQIGVKSRPEVCTVKSKPGDRITVHYTGMLTDGTKFDSSLDRGDPFEFMLGTGQVIKGWDQGLNAMCVGEKRRLKIPSDLGYGAMGSPPKIPGGATLIFDVEMLKINGQA